MQENKVGKIKRLKYNEEEDSLEVTIEIKDPKFKKKILRDLDLLGKLTFDKDSLIYNGDNDDADL